MRPDTLFKADCKSIKCRKRLLLSQVKCIFALKESFFDRGKRKQNIVIRSFLNRYLFREIYILIICISKRDYPQFCVNSKLQEGVHRALRHTPFFCVSILCYPVQCPFSSVDCHFFSKSFQ